MIRCHSGFGPPADLDRGGGPNPLADMDRGSISASGFGPGGPILGGSKSARTPARSFGSRLKGMPQKDLINIRNYDVRHLIPKVRSAVLKNGAEIVIESIVK